MALLARGIDGGSIHFPLLVKVSEEESAVFAATIHGMDERVFAMGNGEEEAAMQAVEMFMDIVDAAIGKGLPLKPILGEVFFRRTTMPMDQARVRIRQIAEMIEEEMSSRANASAEEWSRVNVMPGFMPFVHEMALQA